MILEVKNLSYSYKNGKEIFKNVNFSITKGTILSILGPNGAGKSTLLNCIANFYPPTDGEILIDGVPLKTISLQNISKKIGYVPQIHTPTYAYTVKEFVVMGRTPYLGMFEKPSKSDYDIVDDTLKLLGIGPLANMPYTEISGGERQQATIARAIVQKPDIIILDEPTSHLDYGNQLRTIKIIRSLAKQGFAIIMTTHTPDHALLLDDKVGILDYSGTFLVGNTNEIMTEERLSKLYQSDLHLVYLEEIHRTICVSNSL